MAATLRPIRDRALSDLSAVVTAMWGDRCPMREGGCACCAAWSAFDLIRDITDGSTLDEADDYAGVAERFHLTKYERFHLTK